MATDRFEDRCGAEFVSYCARRFLLKRGLNVKPRTLPFLGAVLHSLAACNPFRAAVIPVTAAEPREVSLIQHRVLGDTVSQRRGYRLAAAVCGAPWCADDGSDRSEDMK